MQPVGRMARNLQRLPPRSDGFQSLTKRSGLRVEDGVSRRSRRLIRACSPSMAAMDYNLVMPERTTARAVCPHDCPDTCSITVTLEGGRAVAVAGDRDHPFTAGFLCPKVSRYLDRVY